MTFFMITITHQEHRHMPERFLIPAMTQNDAWVLAQGLLTWLRQEEARYWQCCIEVSDRPVAFLPDPPQ
jgi:hypothetical protein